MAKIWEERIVGYHAYYEAPNKDRTYGDVRAQQLDPSAGVNYSAIVYTPVPGGVKLGTFSSLEDAKMAVQQECIRQGL